MYRGGGSQNGAKNWYPISTERHVHVPLKLHTPIYMEDTFVRNHETILQGPSVSAREKRERFSTGIANRVYIWSGRGDCSEDYLAYILMEK